MMADIIDAQEKCSMSEAFGSQLVEVDTKGIMAYCGDGKEKQYIRVFS